MREIKFRVWDTDNKTMHPVSMLMIGFGATAYTYPKPGEEADVGTEDIARIVMQYTGLKDKNGKEIYEGDIVKGQYTHYDPCLDDYVKDEKMGGIVYWDLYSWSFKVIESLCDKDREGKINYFNFTDEKDYWAPQIFEELEVIGNIYENPNLLT